MKSMQINNRLRALEGTAAETAAALPLVARLDPDGAYTADSWPYMGQRFTVNQLKTWPAPVIVDDLADRTEESKGER